VTQNGNGFHFWMQLAVQSNNYKIKFNELSCIFVTSIQLYRNCR